MSLWKGNWRERISAAFISDLLKFFFKTLLLQPWEMLIWQIHSTCFPRLKVACKLLFYYRSCVLALKTYVLFSLIPVLRTPLYTVLEKIVVVQIHHFTTHSSSRGNKTSCKEWMVLLQHKEFNLSKQVKQQWK